MLKPTLLSPTVALARQRTVLLASPCFAPALSVRCPTASTSNLNRPPPALRSASARQFSTSRSWRNSWEQVASAGKPAEGLPEIVVLTPAAPTKRRALKATKAAITLTPQALIRIRSLLASPTPQLVRISVKNKGCAGMSYHLEYVQKPEKFDEIVTQDGVKVVVDSKALFSIIGSEMDWQEDALMSKFVFKNPNITDECGCGESFTV